MIGAVYQFFAMRGLRTILIGQIGQQIEIGKLSDRGIGHRTHAQTNALLLKRELCPLSAQSDADAGEWTVETHRFGFSSIDAAVGSIEKEIRAIAQIELRVRIAE